MKKIKRWLKEMFDPEVFNDIDTAAIVQALNDPSVRAAWLFMVLDELRQINLEVDKRLLSGSLLGISELCSRRKTFQDVLEMILSSRRKVTQGTRPNPPAKGPVDLDRVTA